MNDFQLHLPTNYVFGRGVENQVGGLTRATGAEKVLIVYGGGSVVRSGVLDRVEASLADAGLPFLELEGVRPNPTDDKVRQGILLCREKHIDFLLAVGGGSVIDTAKAIAIGVPYDGDFWDAYTGRFTPTEALPVGVVLTIPAAGSEGSGNTVITNMASGIPTKLSLRLPNLLRPLFALLNPELTFTLPPFQTFCGVADMMAHVLERYFTNTPDVSLTDRLCEGTLRSIIETAPRLLEHPDDYEARANIMWAGTIAHNGICGVGREEDWASHFIEHEISAMYDVTHGAGLSVVFPAWMRFVAQRPLDSTEGSPRRVAQFAIRVMQVAPESEEAAILSSAERTRTTALAGIEALKRFFRSLGLPTRMNELHNGPVDILALVNNLHANKGPLVGAYVKLNSYNTATIYRYCCEG